MCHVSWDGTALPGVVITPVPDAAPPAKRCPPTRSGETQATAAFRGSALLAAPYRAAASHGYLWREFGGLRLFLRLAQITFLPLAQITATGPACERH